VIYSGIIQIHKGDMASTPESVTEVPEGELVRHPHEIIRRVKSGEEIRLTGAGRAVIEMRRIDGRGAMSWDEFWTALEQIPIDPSFAADVRDLVGDESTDDLPDRL
jgi:antitoxin (DNA-binding transcriptional repressor) of toxin-antitoxin stability system